MSNEIEAETIRHLGKVRKPVSPEPIQLTVYSGKVPNLTLVDMPGQNLHRPPPPPAAQPLRSAARSSAPLGMALALSPRAHVLAV